MNSVFILVMEKLLGGVFFTRGYLPGLLVLNDYMLRDLIKLPFLTVWYVLPYKKLSIFIKYIKETILPVE